MVGAVAAKPHLGGRRRPGAFAEARHISGFRIFPGTVTDPTRFPRCKLESQPWLGGVPRKLQPGRADAVFTHVERGEPKPAAFPSPECDLVG